MIKINIRLLCSLLLLILPFAHAEDKDDLPSYYPNWYSSSGILQDVNMKSASLVINATRYQYDTNVKVHSLNTKYSSIRALRINMEVGYNFNERGDKKLISEIWVLPKGTVELR